MSTFLRGNIGKLYVIQAMQWAHIAMPIFVLYLLENGLTLMEVLLLQSAFSIGLIILEIPSGYLSDRWGRKKTIVSSCVLAFFGYVMYASGTSFWMFFAAEIILAFAYSFSSGTMEALTYDSLLENGEEDQYREVTSSMMSVAFLLGGFAALVGGLIAPLGLRVVVYCELVFIIIAFFFSIFLHEPERKKLQEGRHLMQLLRITQKTLLRDSRLRSIAFLNAILSSMTLLLVWLSQPYQEFIGLPLYLFGVVYAVMSFGLAANSKLMVVLAKRFDDRMLLLGISLTLVVVYVLLSQISSIWLGMIVLIFGRSVFGALRPLVSDMVNALTGSETRATVLSIIAFFMRIVFAIAAPLFGYYADIFSLQQTFLLIGIIASVSLVIIFILMRGVWKKIPR